MAWPTILLFDIDGTLIDTGGAGRRALERAFRKLCGEGDWLDFSLAGMTDRAIVRTALQRGSGTEDEEEIDRLLDRYLQVLAEEIAQTPRYTVHPGVRDIVAHAAARPQRYAAGLGTGNLERGAQIKLAPARLYEALPFGGFGSDHEDRAEVLRIGAQRGADRLGRSVKQCRVVVIGDTPRDVAAAATIGATCVAVATGPYATGELRAAGATAAFDNLAQDGAHDAIFRE